jgi:multiple sugar transport system permease protein
MAAASIVTIIPVLVFAFLVQRWLVRGLTFGAVKG